MVTKASDLRANPNPIDPDVKVPAAVRRAAEAAEAAQRAAYPDQNTPTPPTPPANPDTISIAPPAPSPDPAPAHTPAPAPVTPQGNEPPTPPQWAPEVELEFQRIRSAEGRKRAALETQLAQSNDRIASLESAIHDLQNRQPVAPAPAPARLVTEQEVSEFGPEMLDVMGRRALESVSPELAELRRMMGVIAQKVEGTATAVVKNAREDMHAALDGTLPEWRKINMMPEFKAWLALPDPLFGVSRQSELTKAYEKNETTRVLNFFKGFVSELAATTPDIELPAPPAPAPAKTQLETLAAPGRARTSAQPNAPAEKQIITTADVNAFYAAVRQGRYNGREAEKEALEQELFAAQREGRVRAV